MIHSQNVDMPTDPSGYGYPKLNGDMYSSQFSCENVAILMMSTKLSTNPRIAPLTTKTTK